MSLDPTTAALEWALRLILASALVIHAILDLTDPCHGAKSGVLQVENSLPRWFLPAVGLLRAVAAFALFSEESYLVLGALAYSSMLWSGAVYFHVRREHHPASALPAVFFVLLVFAITAMRMSFWMALVGTAACAAAAVVLGWLFVTPPEMDDHRAL